MGAKHRRSDRLAERHAAHALGPACDFRQTFELLDRTRPHDCVLSQVLEIALQMPVSVDVEVAYS
jgi:hypothetical protein